MNRTTIRLTGLAAALLAGGLALTGCSSSDTNTASTGISSAAGSPAGESVNAADVEFATNMREHHEGALAMAQLATTRAADQRVEDLAARVRAAQQPEIDKMTDWLADWGAATSSSASNSMGDMSGMPGMDHGSASSSSSASGGSTASSGEMPGMDMSRMTAEDMAALEAASGRQFDLLFLDTMSTHHSAAVNMAKDEIATGKNADAIAMATSIRDSQTAEISEMQQLRTSLGG